MAQTPRQPEHDLRPVLEYTLDRTTGVFKAGVETVLADNPTGPITVAILYNNHEAFRAVQAHEVAYLQSLQEASTNPPPQAHQGLVFNHAEQKANSIPLMLPEQTMAPGDHNDSINWSHQDQRANERPKLLPDQESPAGPQVFVYDQAQLEANRRMTAHQKRLAKRLGHED